MATLVNLTPHDLNIINLKGIATTIEKSGQIARVTETRTFREPLDGIGVSSTVFGEVEGLPEPVDGVFLIVSQLVRSAVPHRKDVLSPGLLIRDEAGNPKGCEGLTGN